MIVILTSGDYSDYGLDSLLQVSSREDYEAAVLAYREHHPRMRLPAWRKGLYDYLLETGVATVETDWIESHNRTCKAEYGAEPRGESCQ